MVCLPILELVVFIVFGSCNGLLLFGWLFFDENSDKIYYLPKLNS